MGSYFFFVINIFFIDILFSEVKEKNKNNKKTQGEKNEKFSRY